MVDTKFNAWLLSIVCAAALCGCIAVIAKTPEMYREGHVDAAMRTGESMGICAGIFAIGLFLSLREAITGKGPME